VAFVFVEVSVEYLNYFLFFMLGVTFVKAFGFFVSVGLSLRIIKVAEASTLRMLVSITQDVSFAREIKYHAASEAGVSEGALARVKLIDEETIKNWKEMVIKRLIQCYPHSYRGYVEYSNWSEAMKYLDRLARKK